MHENEENTFRISFNDIIKVYRKNPHFRAQLYSGCFVYASDMLVVNNPQLVTYHDGKAMLTDANMHSLDEIALPFTVTEFRTAGNANAFDPPKVIRAKGFNSDENKKLKAQCAHVLDIQKKLWSNFINNTILSLDGWGMLNKFIEDYDVSEYNFCNKTLLGEHYYRRAKSKKNIDGQPDKMAMLSFVVGYDLPHPIAIKFLEAAGHHLSLASEIDMCYTLVICTMAGYPMDEKNAWLNENGVEMLGSKQKK